MFVSLSMLELFAFIFTGKEQFYTETAIHHSIIITLKKNHSGRGEDKTHAISNHPIYLPASPTDGTKSDPSTNSSLLPPEKSQNKYAARQHCKQQSPFG